MQIIECKTENKEFIHQMLNRMFNVEYRNHFVTETFFSSTLYIYIALITIVSRHLDKCVMPV